MNIVILGYYSHGNYGDDLFEVIFKKLYSEHNLSFYDPNKLSSIPESTDIIICGGGDIINDWFMEQISKLKIRAEQKANRRIPTYAISIGVTFKKSIPSDKPYYLDIFDYWIVRNKIDVTILKTRYPEENIIYVPDVVHLLSTYKPKKISNFINNWFSMGSGSLKPIVGIFLTNTISNSGTNKNYDNEISKFAELIESIPQIYNIHLVPFNVGINKNENDSILNEKIYKKLNSQQKFRVSIKNFNLKELVGTFRSSVYTYGICMRYHSHILCQTYSIPFISVSMTNKTFEYMRDFGIQRYWIDYTSRELDIQNFQKLFVQLTKEKDFFKTQTESKVITTEKFLYPIKNKITRKSGPKYFLMEDFVKTFNGIVEKLIKAIFKEQDMVLATSIFIKKYCVADVYKYFKLGEATEQTRKFITKFIIYEMFGKIDTEYNYGLQEKVIECNLYENILWIYENSHFKGIDTIDNNSLNTSINPSLLVDFDQCGPSFNTFLSQGPLSILLTEKNSLERPSLNFCWIDNTFNSKTHRSGWEYAGSNLIRQFHSPEAKSIVDLYVDKTFLWNSSVYESNKKIPYTVPWIGFIHHTPNPEYTPNSLNAILESKLFIQSLKTCKGLIVLSNYLKKYLDSHFKGKIKVHSLTHPTETPDLKFTLQAFESNQLKQIIQIGGWLRNSYAIYELGINSKKLNISKALLQGTYMENYVKPNTFDQNQLVKYMEKNPPELNKRMCSVSTNKYIEGLVRNIQTSYDSVQIIPTLENNEYDELLSKNIVFINLVNASACNTLIECVVRNTPILINRLEAVEEILGANYPLYYDSIQEAGELATDINKIKEAHIYLTKLDKTKLSISIFIKEFEQIAQAVCN
jgi:polysaccharide pyruvyl transferase WcaK-like protein